MLVEGGNNIILVPSTSRGVRMVRHAIWWVYILSV